MAKDGSISLDFDQFTRKTKRMLREIDTSKDEFLDDQAKLLFRDVAKFTPPFAYGDVPPADRKTIGTNEDKQQGIKAVRAGIAASMQPVAPASKWRNPRIQKLVTKKNKPALQAIYANAEGSTSQGYAVRDFNPQLHENARNHRGRVKKSQQVLAIPHGKRKKYISNVSRKVGAAKAVFAMASMAFGGKAPAWVKRHFTRTSISVERSENNRGARGRAAGLIHSKRFLNRIQQGRARAAEQRLLFLTQKAGKKAGFKIF